MAEALSSEDNANEIALKGLCKSLLLCLVSGVGAETSDNLLCVEIEDYFSDYAVKIEQYTEQSTSPETRKFISMKMNEFIRYLLTIHLLDKRHELSNPVKIYERLRNLIFGPLEQMVNFLKSFPGAECALSVFIAAASFKLLLLQELALIDPRENNSLHSSHLIELRKNVRRYCEYVERTYKNLVQARVRAVSALRVWSIESICSVSWEDKYHLKYMRSTKLYGSQWCNGEPHILIRKAKEERSKHLYNTLNEIERELDSPLQTVVVWRTLLTQPIPNYQPPTGD